MKKIFFTLILAIIFIFLLPNTAHGLVTNTFSCKFDSASNKCVLGIVDCTNGMIPDPDKCTVVSNPNGLRCLTQIFPCIEAQPTKWRCDTGQRKCVPDPNGPHDDYQFCDNLCFPPTVPPNPTSAPTSSDLWCDPNWLGIGTKLNTAIGCIPILTTKEAFLSFVLKWAVGIGGGIAFLLIVYAGFMIMTSAGNPERLKAGQELLTSAISGLILLIFSVVILKIIGVDILGLCKFGFGPAC